MSSQKKNNPKQQKPKTQNTKPQTQNTIPKQQKPWVEIHIRNWREIGDPSHNTKAFWKEKKKGTAWESNFEVKLGNIWGFPKHWENNSVERAESFSAGQYTEADPVGKPQHVAKAGGESYIALEITE